MTLPGGASERSDEGASTCSSDSKIPRHVREKIFPACQNVHKLSTDHPHVFHRAVSPRALRRRCCCSSVRFAQAAPPDASLYRVFLRDGTTLLSYGEFARVADRIVVSLPIGRHRRRSGAAPRQHSGRSVDWEKTDAYADSVRAARYAAHARSRRFRAARRSGVDIALHRHRADGGSGPEDRDGRGGAPERDEVDRRALRLPRRGRRRAWRRCSTRSWRETRAAAGVKNFDLEPDRQSRRAAVGAAAAGADAAGERRAGAARGGAGARCDRTRVAAARRRSRAGRWRRAARAAWAAPMRAASRRDARRRGAREPRLRGADARDAARRGPARARWPT